MDHQVSERSKGCSPKIEHAVPNTPKDRPADPFHSGRTDSPSPIDYIFNTRQEAEYAANTPRIPRSFKPAGNLL